MFHASFRTYEDAAEKRSDECGSLIVQIVPAWSRNVYRGVRVDEFVHACPTSQRNCASLATNHCPACTGNPSLAMPNQMTLNEVTTAHNTSSPALYIVSTTKRRLVRLNGESTVWDTTLKWRKC